MRIWLACLVLILAISPALSGEPALRQTIDRELHAAWQAQRITPAGPADDGTFLRRVSLDLIGTVPTYEETLAFLQDSSKDKRARLVDRLLSDPRFATAQANVWDLILFGRNPSNGDATRKRDTFKNWLARQFAENVPYDVWVKDLLLAEKEGPELYHVQFRNQPEEATVALTKTFLGTQLQCARCHDHPYDRWTQKDFYGMAGFFVRLVVQERGTGNARTFTIGEKASGEILFSGAAADQAPGKKGVPVKARFLGGPDLDEPPIAKETKEPAAKPGVPLPKPAFSRKARLAEWVTSPTNPLFARAIANRIWAQFLGRGLIHPVDDFHANNTPSHPALLEALTSDVVARRFDLKGLMREIVLSKGYGLARSGSGKDALPLAFEQARIRPLSAEELMASLRQVTGYDIGLKPGEKLPNSGEEYFLRIFGEPTNGLGDFQGSLQEHLFLNNGEHVRRFLMRKKGNLIDILLSSTDPWERRLDRLFLTILQRLPTEKERHALLAHITQGPKIEARLEDALWVLINGSEFRFNH